MLKIADIVPEEYEFCYLDEFYSNIDKITEMSYEDGRFLNGLLRYFKPEKVLEVGVAAGASTCVMLNALRDNPRSVIHSVDLSEKYYRDRSLSSGWKIFELFPNTDRCFLYLGNDVSDVVEDQIKGEIDFLLLDTVHRHPAETLSFLSIFPYLKKDAIVVLHDVNLFFSTPHTWRDNATKLLLDTIVADKITLRNFKLGYIHPNIAALQINEDTHKYIADVFCSLFFTWSYVPSERILKATELIIKNKYSKDLYDLYIKSIKQNNDTVCQSKFCAMKRELRAILRDNLPSSLVDFLREKR
jgi:predicted O-methyltransferase YrrM